MQTQKIGRAPLRQRHTGENYQVVAGFNLPFSTEHRVYFLDHLVGIGDKVGTAGIDAPVEAEPA